MLLRKVFTSPAVWVILLLLMVGYGLAAWVNNIGGPEAVQQKYGAMAPLLTGTILFLLSPTPFPTDLILLAHGALYGFIFAGLLNWFVLWLEIFLEIWIGRRLGSDFDVEQAVNKLPVFLQRFPVGHPAFLILGRLIPTIGSNITTMLPGAMGVPVFRIAWCSAIGIIPGAFGLAAMGAGLVQL